VCSSFRSRSERKHCTADRPCECFQRGGVDASADVDVDGGRVAGRRRWTRHSGDLGRAGVVLQRRGRRQRGGRAAHDRWTGTVVRRRAGRVVDRVQRTARPHRAAVQDERRRHDRSSHFQCTANNSKLDSPRSRSHRPH